MEELCKFFVTSKKWAKFLPDLIWVLPNASLRSPNLALGAAYGTAKSGTGIAAMSVMRPELIMKSIIPVVMAGIIAIYGLVVAVLIAGALEEPSKYSLYKWVAFFRYFSPNLFESCDHWKKINDHYPLHSHSPNSPDNTSTVAHKCERHMTEVCNSKFAEEKSVKIGGKVPLI